MSEKDIFRDTWIRYFGYANEVGEAFRCMVPCNVVHASYSIAISYVILDAADKGWKMMQKKDSNPLKVAVAAGDALIWQTLASVVIPGFTINRICAVTRYVLTVGRFPPVVRTWATVGAGLVSIPIIIHPIDTGVTAFMNATYRQWVK